MGFSSKKIVSTGFCSPSTKCLLKKVPYGITSCLGKNRTGPTLVHIVVVVLKRNGPMEILMLYITRLAQTFTHHRRKQDILKNAENGKFMMEAK